MNGYLKREMNKIVLITGGTRGFGFSLAEKFWKEGFNILIISKNKKIFEKGKKKFSKKKNQFIKFFSCDLSKPEKVKNLINKIKSEFKYINVLINNAAIHGPIGEFSYNNMNLWNKTIMVNLISPILLCHGLIPLLKKNKNSSIINISGGGATKPRVNFSAYATAKTGLVRFTEIIAQELKSYDIKANCIAPGAMKTSLLREVLKRKTKAGKLEIQHAKKILSQKKNTMKKACDLAFFLASDLSQNITGRIISANWDNWKEIPHQISKFSKSDVFTLRRVLGKDRGFNWCDYD